MELSSVFLHYMDMRRSITLFLGLGLLLVLFSGCATTHKVRVDALSMGSVNSGSGFTYVLASGTEGVDETDLFFKTVGRHVNPVLTGKGYRLVEDPTMAELVIVVDAYMSEPLVETRHYSEPVYLRTGGYYHRYRVPVVNKDGKVVRYHYGYYWDPGYMHHGGWVNSTSQITVYDKVLHLSAKRLLPTGEAGEEEWTTKAVLRNRSTDYRSALPILLMAATPYIGEETEKQETITIREDSPELESYKVN